jgi:hypothetical protein
MPSTAIRTIDYDAEQHQLWVTFVSGRTYVYDRVPEDVHQAFVGYSSKGEFFNRFIRDRYRHREVKKAG